MGGWAGRRPGSCNTVCLPSAHFTTLPCLPHCDSRCGRPGLTSPQRTSTPSPALPCTPPTNADIDDLAAAHVLAMVTPATGRFIVSAESASLLDWLRELRPQFPKYWIPAISAPLWLLWVLSKISSQYPFDMMEATYNKVGGGGVAGGGVCGWRKGGGVECGAGARAGLVCGWAWMEGRGQAVPCSSVLCLGLLWTWGPCVPRGFVHLWLHPLRASGCIPEHLCGCIP